MEFDKRLQRAIQRGERRKADSGHQKAAEALSEQELKNTHSRMRIELSEHIESCLRQLCDHFPGFQFVPIFGEEGWGSRLTRDDLDLRSGTRSRNAYSRMEMLIRPFSSTQIIELTAKGTIRNREAIDRTHYQFLSEADIDSFKELIDLWVLEFAEKYSSD